MPAPDPLALPAVPAPAPADHPRRDATVVILFALALVLFAFLDPLKGRALHVENRALAAWPRPPFGRDVFARFDAAFADRFGARNALIALQHALVVLGLRTSTGGHVVLGRDDWLYFAGEDGHALDRHVRGTMPFPDAQIDGLAREIERRRAWLAARGIAYVVTVAPDKATIYPEHLPRWLEPMTGPTPLERATRALQANAALRFVDLRAPLRAAKAR